MTVDALIAQATASFSGILTDVFNVAAACVNILIILTAGRILYAFITQQSVIPEGIFSHEHEDNEREFESMVEQEERKYHQGIMRNNAKLEVMNRHKYDL
jgi:hypothetical protein